MDSKNYVELLLEPFSTNILMHLVGPDYFIFDYSDIKTFDKNGFNCISLIVTNALLKALGDGLEILATDAKGVVTARLAKLPDDPIYKDIVLSDFTWSPDFVVKPNIEKLAGKTQFNKWANQNIQYHFQSATKAINKLVADIDQPSEAQLAAAALVFTHWGDIVPDKKSKITGEVMKGGFKPSIVDSFSQACIRTFRVNQLPKEMVDSFVKFGDEIVGHVTNEDHVTINDKTAVELGLCGQSSAFSISSHVVPKEYKKPLGFGNFEWKPDLAKLKLEHDTVVCDRRHFFTSGVSYTWLKADDGSVVKVTYEPECARGMTSPYLCIDYNGVMYEIKDGKAYCNGINILTEGNFHFSKLIQLDGKVLFGYRTLKEISDQMTITTANPEGFESMYDEFKDKLSHFVDLDIALTYPTPLTQLLLTTIIDQGFEVIYTQSDWDWVQRTSKSGLETTRINGHYAIDLCPDVKSLASVNVHILMTPHYANRSPIIVLVKTTDMVPTSMLMQDDDLICILDVNNSAEIDKVIFLDKTIVLGETIKVMPLRPLKVK